MRRFRRPGRALRGMLNRGFRRSLRPGGPAARLRRAHQAMADRQFAAAAAEYLALAEAAQLRGLPQGAPLLIAAGMAAVEGGDADRGVEHILRGLDEFRRRGQVRRLALAARRIGGELRSRGYPSIADRIESQVPGGGIELTAEPSAEAVRLPAKCPQCGGSVHPEEVDWADPRSAICDYCGSILPVET